MSVRVTVAPGGFVIVDHPSGLAALGKVTIAAGESAFVSEQEADRLYAKGMILHPVTGRPKPAPPPTPPLPEGVLISIGNGPYQAIGPNASMQLAAEERRLRDEIEERAYQDRRAGRVAPPPDQVEYPPLVSTTTADGKPWPNW